MQTNRTECSAGQTLSDASIGELWLSFVLTRGQQTYAHQQRYKDMVEMLIHKLVEERAWHYNPILTSYREGQPTENAMKRARRDFGIPEEGWK